MSEFAINQGGAKRQKKGRRGEIEKGDSGWCKQLANLATVVAHTMAATPLAAYDNNYPEQEPEIDSEQDAEGDEDPEFYDATAQAGIVTTYENSTVTVDGTYHGNGEADEGDAVDENNVNHEKEPSLKDDGNDSKEKVDQDAAVIGSASEDGKSASEADELDAEFEELSNESNAVASEASSESDSEAEEEWEAESNEQEDADTEPPVENNCM